MEPYNVKIITYPDLSKQIRIYSKSIYSLGRFKKNRYRNPIDGEWTSVIDGDIRKHYEHISEVSMKRTQKKIFDYAKCNSWDWFTTFTFNKEKVNRYDYAECIKKLKMWLDYVRRSSPALSYLVVPERHKDGAWHFHGLFSGLDSKQIVWTGKNVIKRKGRGFVRTQDKIYKFGSYKLGWMTATEVREKEKVTGYICKYITKDLCSASTGRKRYWASRNLEIPQEEVFDLDATDRFILKNELLESSSFSKTSSVQYGALIQTVNIFDID